MSKTTEHPVQVMEFTTFDLLLAELQKTNRSHLRVARVINKGMVESYRNKKRKGFTLQPRVQVVATILDHTVPEILRFDKKWDTGADTTCDDKTGLKTRDKIINALEARGFAVSRGEWTVEVARAALF